MNWRSRPSSPDDCETILPLLSLQADGMTSADETRRVEAHLGDCDGCRSAQRWMQATQMAIAQRVPVAPPADLRSRIAQAVAAQAAPVVFATRRPFVLRPAFAAAASLAVAAAWVGHAALTSRPTPPDVPPTRVAVAPTVTPPAPPVPAVKPPTRRATTVKPVARVKPIPPRLAVVKPVERPAQGPTEVSPRVTAVAPPPPSARPESAAPRPLIARKPTGNPAPLARPRTVTRAPDTRHIANVPKTTVPDVKPAVPPSPAISPDPAPMVVVVTPPEPAAPVPAPVRTASAPDPAPVRVARAHSGNLAHLISFGSDNAPRKISMDKSARAQAAPFVQGPLAYTPTHEEPGRE